MKLVLVASKNQAACYAIRSSLGSDYKVEVASSKDGCLAMFRKKKYEFLFVDVEFLRESTQDSNYRVSLQLFWYVYPAAVVIVMSSQEMIREAVMAVKSGASNYLTYPVDPEEVQLLTESIHDSIIVQSELDYLRDQFWQSDSLEVVQTKSGIMQTVFDQVRSVAPTKSTVLLVGDTGTGKGVLAKLIHRHSNRNDSPFISVHCGAIPDTLVESELFGHEKGAFTGAVRRKLGKFEIAHGGTIFLDEIGTITPSAQIKLLHVLQDGSFHRVGGEEINESDVRVIAATNMDLQIMCEEGTFRRDLFYRLNVFPIVIPSLKDKKEDIPLLAEVFLKKLNKFHMKGIHGIHPHVLQAFSKYSWPGNIRELENLMERAYILETLPVLTPASFPIEIISADSSPLPGEGENSLTLGEVRRRAISDAEKYYLTQLLIENRGRIKDAAEAAGISTRQLHKLMKKHYLRKEEFKPGLKNDPI